jgi:hypothetical protein
MGPEQKNSPSVETERPFRLLAICKILKKIFLFKSDFPNLLARFFITAFSLFAFSIACLL